MFSTSPRLPRLAAGLLAGGLALVPLAGCSFASGNVSCTTRSCTTTLSADSAEAEIFGATVSFGGIQDGRASLSVGGAGVSCAEGERVSAGPLQVECTSITDDAVEIKASLG